MSRQVPSIERLPRPAQRPGADVVIFDGHCNFCRRSVLRFAELDRRQRLAFLSLHDPETAQRFPALDRDEALSQMVVADAKGAFYGGARALRYLSRRLPALWLFAIPLHLPGSLPVWQSCYRWIARRRYLWGGQACEGDACRDA